MRRTLWSDSAETVPSRAKKAVLGAPSLSSHKSMTLWHYDINIVVALWCTVALWNPRCQVSTIVALSEDTNQNIHQYDGHAQAHCLSKYSIRKLHHWNSINVNTQTPHSLRELDQSGLHFLVSLWEISAKQPQQQSQQLSAMLLQHLQAKSRPCQFQQEIPICRVLSLMTTNGSNRSSSTSG